MSFLTGRMVKLAAALMLAVCAQASAGEPAKEKPKHAPPVPSVHTVKNAPFRVDIKLKGVFEAQGMAEIGLWPKKWADFRMVKAVPHATEVRKGDMVLWLDTTKINESIGDAENARELSELAFLQAGDELKRLEESVPLDLAAAERAKRVFDEDLKRYMEIDRPLAVKAAEARLESAQFSLKYAQEELRQLEKMYEADDLTEETEEIILERARNAVKRAKLRLEQAQVQHDRFFNVELPRRDEKNADDAKRQAIAFEKARATLPQTLKKKRLEVEKLKRDRKKSDENLAKLREDREAMSVRAPLDGIMYYGACVRGKWARPDPISACRTRSRELKPFNVLMTIVRARPMFVRASVAEKDLSDIRPGMSCTATPAMNEKMKLKAKVLDVSSIPISTGVFDAKIEVDLGKDAAALMPGMSCTVKLVPYSVADAIAVPKKAVFTDDIDEDVRYVYVERKGEKPEKRKVAVGRESLKKVEILDGLKEGEKVLLEKPKD